MVASAKTKIGQYQLQKAQMATLLTSVPVALKSFFSASIFRDKFSLSCKKSGNGIQILLAGIKTMKELHLYWICLTR